MRDEVVLVPSGPYQISTRVTGEGPLIIMMHGFPELGLSWRHQQAAVAAAGYTVAAPDMRGYGGSSKPKEIEAYKLNASADDMAAIADHLGFEQWVSVGHDFGAAVAWRTALRFPDRVRAVFTMSVPYSPPPVELTLARTRAAFAGKFFYVLYFQDVGVAEAEFERDPRWSMKQMFFSASGDAPMNDWVRTDRPSEGPMLPGLTKPPEGPLSFITDAELDAYADAFAKGGFFGPVSWYRNSELDFQETRDYFANPQIHQPAGFLYGEKDIVVAGRPDSLDVMRRYVADIRFERMIPGAGHWVQQESPDEATAGLLEFLAKVDG